LDHSVSGSGFIEYLKAATIKYLVGFTATAPASEVEAVIRSPTNMAAAKIVAADFNKMTSK